MRSSGYIPRSGGTVMNMMQGELQPASPLRRDQVLAYIIEHSARHGTSPTLAEIGQHLDGISQPRVRELVGQLIKTGGLTKTAGSQRNLRVNDVPNANRHLNDVLRRLKWTVADPMKPIDAPLPHERLPRAPRISDHDGTSRDPSAS